MTEQVFLLRADASTQIGTGHVMRCLALAQAWQDAGGAAHFVAVEMPAGLQERLAAEGMPLHWLDVVPGSNEDAAQTTALARQLGAPWVVEDGYHFGADYQHAIKEGGLRLLAIDDYGHAGHYVADLVLNQNIYANASIYPSRAPETQLLLGTQYVLLRREFLRWRGWQRYIPDVARKVLVTMGGGDSDNVTLKVIKAMEQVQIDGLEVIVVVGAGNPNLATLRTVVQRSQHIIRLEQNVMDMPELVAWADVAVAAGGSTCWEMVFMGLPAIVVTLAMNQQRIAGGLHACGAAVSVGSHDGLDETEIASTFTFIGLDPCKRDQMNTVGQELVDGNGALRVVRCVSGSSSLPIE